MLLAQFCTACIGAAAQEAIWWYNARFQLSEARYAQTLRSLSYWLILLTFIGISGICTMLWFSGESPSSRTVLVMGASLPLMFKQGLKAQSRRHLGSRLAARFTVGEYVS